MDPASLDQLTRLQDLLAYHTALLNDHIRDSTLAVSDLEEELEHVFVSPTDGYYADATLARFYSAVRQIFNTFGLLSERVRIYRVFKASISRQMDEITRRS